MAQESSHSLRPGTKLKSKDRVYEIVEVLGSGSFGITYKAIAPVPVGNITIDMNFAIKEHFVAASCYRAADGATVLSVPQAKNDVAESRSDFITEANRLQRLCLKSRNIVSVNETFEANDTAYYVMEFLDGGSPSKCHEEDAISIAKQIANALYEIHQEKVLHLDVKPDNIVLKKNERGETYPVLIDFGISKHFDSKGRPTTKLNAKGASPGYAPQEQYADISEFSPKYDIYALGAVLYYLTTGKNPPDAFRISPNQQEIKKEISGKVSTNVETAILNAMKPSAMERTSTIQQFCDDMMGVDFVPVLNVSNRSLSFEKGKGYLSMAIDSNISWSVYTDADWCKVKKEGKNVIISVFKNKETGDRICQVIVKGSTYPITQTINVVQKGQGTTPIRRHDKWWDLHRKHVYQASGAVLVGCCAVGLFILFKPAHSKETNRLTTAIVGMNGPVLKKYAELESIRAYLPYSEFLINQKDYSGGIEYAEKMLATSDSTKARRLIESAQGFIAQELNPIPSQDDNKDEDAASISPVVTERAEEIQTPPESDEERFLTAQRKNDFKELLALAKSNYAKAYYPLALNYYNKGDISNAQKWANKAIAANVDKSKAQSLLARIDSPILENPAASENQPLSDDELFARAKSVSELKALANKGYNKAYAPLAEMLFRSGDRNGADFYARKALSSNVDNLNKQKAMMVIKTLQIAGHYDNGENGGVPEELN